MNRLETLNAHMRQKKLQWEGWRLKCDLSAEFFLRL